jgi:two-component system sensor histidine kinase VicK
MRYTFLPLIFCCFCSMLFLTCCTDSGQTLPIGSRRNSDSILTPKAPLFESGRLAEAQRYVDSAFNRQQSHTIYDYITRYGTDAYVNGIAGNFIAQLRYIDSAVAVLRPYLPNQALSVELANLLIARGGAYFNLKNYNTSFQAYFEAMQAVKKYPDNCTISWVVYNIAMVLYKQQQFGESANYFKEALHYAVPCEENIAYRNNRIQEIQDDIGLCYTKLQQYDSAMHYYRQALDLVMRNPYQMAVDSLNSYNRYRAAAGVITGNMAKVYTGTNRPDSAIALYKRALGFNTNVDMHDRQICLVQLADVYLSTGALQPMRQTLQELRGSLDRTPAKDLEIDYDRLQYRYYERTNEPAKALAALGSYMRLRDSAAVQQARLQQSDIGRELRDKEQQFQIQLLQKNNDIGKTYLWLFGAIALMAIVILALIYTSYSTSKKNVRRLMEMNIAITDANRDKDRILRVVAHDLRNPIGAISTLSQLMTTSDFDEEKTKDLLQSIESLANSSITLINDLMIAQQSMAASDEEKRPTDIKLLLQQAVMVMQFKANEKKQQLQLLLPEEPVHAAIYPVKAERVINNLLANAIKFSQVNSHIELRLDRQEKSILFSVTDHGVGIAPEHLPKVFDQFTSVKRQGTAGEKSFGLGLSICKQIVESMGGKIWVESEPGVGSTFFVQLSA